MVGLVDQEAWLTYVRQLYLGAVHVQLQLPVEVLALPLQHVLGAVAEVDQLVDDSGGDEVERRFPGLKHNADSCSTVRLTLWKL